MSSEEASSRANKSDINRICVGMVVLACLLIAIMLLTSHFQSTSESPAPAGWVAVVGAAIVFGSTGIPMKSPAMSELQVDSFVFAVYTSIGIFIVTLPLFVYLLATGTFEFVPWAILGAGDIVIIGFLAFLAVQRLGYAKAPAIWAGCGMTCAFLWGALAFGESINNVGMAVSAIVLLVLGVYCVSTAQATQEEKSEVTGEDAVITTAAAAAAAASAVKEPHECGVIIDATWAGENPLVTTTATAGGGGSLPIAAFTDEQKDNAEPNNTNTAVVPGLKARVPSVRSGDHHNILMTRKPTNNHGADQTAITIEEGRANAVNGDSQSLNIDIIYSRPPQEAALLKNNNNINTSSSSSSSGGGSNSGGSSSSIRMFPPSSSLFSGVLCDKFNAYLLCFAVGFCDGSLMVPFELSKPQNGNHDLHDVFRYLVSFGLSSIVVGPLLFVLYCLVLKRGTIPPFHAHAAMIPGVASGVLWATANFMSVHATYYLGIKIGFPLTQTCVLIAAFWGVVYFKEIDILHNSGHIYRFGFGILSILLGAYLLGASG